jgi:hypothetical protein
MRVSHWLFGCAICFAGVGSAVATTADSRDADNALRSNGDISAHDSGGELGLAHDVTSHSTSVDSRKSASSNGSDHPSGDITPPAHAPQTHLGWQSLLPGSIQ